jgi:hypothetical protein
MANEFKVKNGLSISGTISGTTVLKSAAAASGVLTLPSATDTLVGLTTTDTLTNKTLSSAVITGTLTAGGSAGTSGQYLQSTATGVQWVTIGGGGSGTTTNSLTIGSGLTGSSFNGSAPVTIAIDSTYFASTPAIGGTLANTAIFTQLTVNGANLNTSISPTGTGTVTIQPATTGVINNMSVGATTAATGAFTTLSQIFGPSSGQVDVSKIALAISMIR